MVKSVETELRGKDVKHPKADDIRDMISNVQDSCASSLSTIMDHHADHSSNIFSLISNEKEIDVKSMLLKARFV